MEQYFPVDRPRVFNMYKLYSGVSVQVCNNRITIRSYSSDFGPQRFFTTFQNIKIKKQCGILNIWAQGSREK